MKQKLDRREFLSKCCTAGITGCGFLFCSKIFALDCCIECLELEECDKELWERFPDFKKHVIALQKKYLEEKHANLIRFNLMPEAARIIA